MGLKATLKYEDQTKSDVCASGLWVNPKYPFMGCSPDGLVGDDGLIEMKSLKIFKNDSVEKVIENWDNLPKDTKKIQCFAVENGKCMLKSSHDYFYQIQMQLLVTERNFCDFIL